MPQANPFVFAKSLLPLCFLLMALAHNASAQVPERMHYQGQLTLANGDLVECADPAPCSQPIALTFRIYSDPVADALLWEEDHLGVVVLGGTFNVTLGSSVPLTPDLLEGPAFLGVEVNGNEELQPRQELVSAAFAMRCHEALNAASLGGVPANGFLTADAVNDAIDASTTSLQEQIEALNTKVLELEELLSQGEGGGEGPAEPTVLVNEVHTSDDCVQAGGITTPIENAQFLCRFQGSSCPSGWSQFQQWSATSSTVCAGTSFNGCPGAGTCGISGHPFANSGTGSCCTNNSCQVDDPVNGVECLSNCSHICFNNRIIEIGCF